MSADDATWSAIADPSRRRIIDLLVRDGPASASSLAGRLPFTRQAVAKHLTVLEAAGLVARTAHGREVRFVVDAARLDAAVAAMAALASEWESRLHAIKRIAEATHRRSSSADDA